MKTWQGNFNSTGAHPNVQAAAASGPTAQDGTPLRATWLTDFVGIVQAALAAVGTTPNDTNELVSNASVTNSLDGSQFLLALRGIMGMPGEVVAWPGIATIPTTYRILELTGQLVAVADYPDLVDAVWIGTTYNATSDSFYRTNSGDTVRADAGTHFRLPDLRGHFLRGLDLAASVDPDGAGRLPGDTQADAILSHHHDEIIGAGAEGYDGSGGSNNLDGATTNAEGILTTGSSSNLITGAVGGAYPTSTENRPTNSVVRYCIRF